jgi:hypothetical protein
MIHQTREFHVFYWYPESFLKKSSAHFISDLTIRSLGIWETKIQTLCLVEQDAAQLHLVLTVGTQQALVQAQVLKTLTLESC